MASTATSCRASKSVATAETAAVRISVIKSAVHRHKRLAGVRAKQDDHGVMGRQTAIVRIKSDELGAERAAISGHDSEETVVLRHRQNLSQGLLHMTCGKIAQCAGHGGISSSIRKSERTSFSSRYISLGAFYKSINSQNFFRSTLPPETIQTIGPFPAFPLNAAASGRAPAPSAMMRAFSAIIRIARRVPSRLTTNESSRTGRIRSHMRGKTL